MSQAPCWTLEAQSWAGPRQPSESRQPKGENRSSCGSITQGRGCNWASIKGSHGAEQQPAPVGQLPLEAGASLGQS